MSLLVSAYYPNVNESRDSSFYLVKGIPLLTCDINKVIFTNKEIYDCLKIYENELTKFIILDEPIYYKYESKFTEFHVNGNAKKDTLKYMLTVCSKTDFVRRATLLFPEYEKYFWIDFGISYIMGDQISFQKLLLKKCNSVSSDKIRIPGCWDLSLKYNINFNIAWFFCGSFFVGNKENIIKFAELMDRKIIEMIGRKNIMWEVNIWYLIYLENTDLFDWYYADHNISMIENL